MNVGNRLLCCRHQVITHILMCQQYHCARVTVGTLLSNSLRDCHRIVTCPVRSKSDKPRHSSHVVIRPEVFDDVPEAKKNKQLFIDACRAFNKSVERDMYKKGHVEFIHAALKRMKEFNIERDIECYNAVLDCFPKSVMVAQTKLQVAFHHFPRQQECCMTVLEQMHSNGVMPDKMSHMLVYDSFGEEAHCTRKLMRIMYWMPKFANSNPYTKNLPSVREGMPDDDLLLAILALERMAVDVDNNIKVYQTKDLPDAKDLTFVASCQSPEQQRIVSTLDTEKPVFVAGPFTVWLRWKSVTYFTMYAEPDTDYINTWLNQHQEERKTDFKSWKIPFSEGSSESSGGRLVAAPSVHQQSDGTVLAMSVTGTHSLDSLRSWVKCLQVDNPHLVHVPVVFKLRSPLTDIVQRKRLLRRPRKGRPLLARSTAVS